VPLLVAGSGYYSCTGTSTCAEYDPSGMQTPSPTFSTPGHENVEIVNRGYSTWGSHNTFLSYHLHYPNGNVVDGAATALPSISLGADITINATIDPTAPGTYTIEWDLFSQYTGPRMYYSASGVRTVSEIMVVPPMGVQIYPRDGTVINSVTPDLAVEVHSDSSTPINVYFTVCPVGGGSVPCVYSAGMPVTFSGSGIDDVDWKVPAGQLYWDVAYSWTFRLSAGGKSYPANGSSGFTTLVPQPTNIGERGISGADVDAQGVNSALGTFVLKSSDLTLPGLTEQLSIPRTYDSANTVTGVFGQGWVSALDSSWTSGPGQLITILFPDGHAESYQPNPDGSYAGGYGQPFNSRVFPSTHQIEADGTVYTFDASTGRIRSIQSSAAETTTFTLSGGAITAITDSGAQRSIYLTYANGLLASESTAPTGGLSWSYAYSGSDLTSACDARGSSACTTYAYETGGVASPRLKSITPPRGTNVVTLTYKTTRISSVSHPDGGWNYQLRTPSAFANDPADAYETVTYGPVSGGQQSISAFNSAGSLLHVSTLVSQPTPTNTKSYVYDAVGHLQAVTDQNGNVEQYTYDPRSGKLASDCRYRDSATLPCTRSTYYSAAAGQLDLRDGNVTQTTDANGNTTTYDYNANGLLLDVKAPPVGGSTTASTTSYTYSCVNDGKSSDPVVNDPSAPAGTSQPCGLLMTRTDPMGLVTSYGHDRYGDVTLANTAAGQSTSSSFNGYGQLISQTVATPQNSTGITTTYTYDAVGHQTSMNGICSCAPQGSPNAVTGEIEQIVTLNSYDLDGDLVSTTKQNGSMTASARTTGYAYDAEDRVISKTPPLGGATRTTYNALGQPTDKWDGNGNHQVTAYTTNAQVSTTSLVNFVDTPDMNTSPRTITLSRTTYDPAGRVASTFDAMGNETDTTYTYDGLRLTVNKMHTDPGSSTPTPYNLHTDTYDLNGNIITDTPTFDVGYSTTHMTVNTYDAHNNRTSVTLDPRGLNRRTTTGYDADDRAISITHTDATRTEAVKNAYDATGQVTENSIHNDATADITTQTVHDGSGNVVSRTDPRGSVAFGQTGIPNPTFTTTYGWDGAGHPATTTTPATTTQDGKGNSAVAAATETDGYDAFGDKTQTLDARGYTTTTKYDGNGRRTETDYPPINASYLDTIAADGATDVYPLDDPISATTVADTTGARPGSWTTNNYRKLTAGGVPNGRSNMASSIGNGAASADVPSDSATSFIGPTTIEAWFTFPRSYTTGGDNFNVLANGGGVWTMDVEGPGLSFLGPTGLISASMNTDPTIWHHVAVTYTPTTGAVMYLDGTMVGSANSYHVPTGTPPDLRIGGNNQPTDGWGSGLQDFAVYNKVLSPAQISAHYKSATAHYSSATAAPSESWTYDAAGNMATHTDRRGQVTSYTYDALNRPYKVVLPPQTAGGAARVQRTTYSDNGQVVSTTDPAGAQILTTFDDLGRTLSVDHVERYPASSDNIERFTYDGAGNIQQDSRAALNLATTYYYNDADEVTSYTTTGRGATTVARDLDGRPTQITGPAPLSLSRAYSYDLAGRLTAATTSSSNGGLSQKISITTDAAGNTTAVTDALNRTTSFTVDNRNRVTAITRPAPTSASGKTLPAPVEQYGYDAVSNPTQLTDGNNHTTLTQFDGNNLPVERDLPTTSATPSTSATTSSYDSAGGPVVTTEGDGTTITKSYDADGNISQVSGNGGTSVPASKRFAYDLDNRLISAGTPGGTDTFTYNDRGSVLSAGHPNAARSGTTTDTRTYDAADRVTQDVSAAGTLTYTYSGPDVASIADSLTGTTHTYAVDTSGLLRTEQDTAGSTGEDTRTFAYDGLGRLASDTTTAPGGMSTAALAYSWDADNELTQQTGSGSLSGTHANHTYTYDSEGRVVTDYDVTSASGNDTGWDAANNRVSATAWMGSPSSKTLMPETDYTYNQRNELLTTTSPTQTTSYAWSPRETLTGTTTTTGTSTSTTTDLFDAFNRLTSNTSATSAQYTYDDLDRLVGTTTANASLQYDLNGAQPVAAPSGWAVTRLTDSTPLSSRATATSVGTNVVTDAEGNDIADVTPATGTATDTRTYDPFGAVTSSTGMHAGIGVDGDVTDTATAQDENQGHWYDPAMGQPTSAHLSAGPAAPAGFAIASTPALLEPGAGGHAPTAETLVASIPKRQPSGAAALASPIMSLDPAIGGATVLTPDAAAAHTSAAAASHFPDDQSTAYGQLPSSSAPAAASTTQPLYATTVLDHSTAIPDGTAPADHTADARPDTQTFHANVKAAPTYYDPGVGPPQPPAARAPSFDIGNGDCGSNQYCFDHYANRGAFNAYQKTFAMTLNGVYYEEYTPAEVSVLEASYDPNEVSALQEFVGDQVRDKLLEELKGKDAVEQQVLQQEEAAARSFPGEASLFDELFQLGGSEFEVATDAAVLSPEALIILLIGAAATEAIKSIAVSPLNQDILACEVPQFQQCGLPTPRQLELTIEKSRALVTEEREAAFLAANVSVIERNACLADPTTCHGAFGKK